MLLQLAGRRCQETGGLDEAFRQVAADRTVAHLFEIDLALLTGAERQALQAAAEAGDPALARLRALGLLQRTDSGSGSGGLAIRNRLLAGWLLR